MKGKGQKIKTLQKNYWFSGIARQKLEVIIYDPFNNLIGNKGGTHILALEEHINSARLVIWHLLKVGVHRGSYHQVI